jgi:hypothetical protein
LVRFEVTHPASPLPQDLTEGHWKGILERETIGNREEEREGIRRGRRLAIIEGGGWGEL